MLNLHETLNNTSSVIAELENEHAHGARALRVRLDLITTAASMLASRPEERAETLAVARLARELRDEAATLRRRHRVVKGIVLSMMD